MGSIFHTKSPLNTPILERSSRRSRRYRKRPPKRVSNPTWRRAGSQIPDPSSQIPDPIPRLNPARRRGLGDCLDSKTGSIFHPKSPLNTPILDGSYRRSAKRLPKRVSKPTKPGSEEVSGRLFGLQNGLHFSVQSPLNTPILELATSAIGATGCVSKHAAETLLLPRMSPG